MSRVTFHTKKHEAELRGSERAHAGLLCSDFLRDSREALKGYFPLRPFEHELNTMILFGNDVTRLLAFLHGQCEIHGFIEEDNREWYAGLIDDGLKLGILRENQGWDAVAALCRNGDGGPVVTDYSVCESFPNEMAAGWAGYEELREDAWYEDFTEDERWELAVKGIRANGCEWSPAKWGRLFGDGTSTQDKVLGRSPSPPAPIGGAR